MRTSAQEAEDAELQRRVDERAKVTAKGLIGPGVLAPVVVKPAKLIRWAKAGLISNEEMVPRLKTTMLRLSTQETVRMCGESQALDDVIGAFEVQRVDGARPAVLKRLLEVERSRDLPRKKTITELQAAIKVALGITKDEDEVLSALAKREEDEQLGGGTPSGD